jgi:hypothetical protein
VTTVCHLCRTTVEDAIEHLNWHIEREGDGDE